MIKQLISVCDKKLIIVAKSMINRLTEPDIFY